VRIALRRCERRSERHDRGNEDRRRESQRHGGSLDARKRTAKQPDGQRPVIFAHGLISRD